MKRFIACMMAIALVFGIAGCAQDTSKQDSEAVVTKYYDYLKKGDYESAIKYHTSDVKDGNDLAVITDSMKDMSNQVDSLSLTEAQGKKVTDAAKHFAKDTIQQYVRSYKIKTDSTKINDDKNKATIKVTVKGINMNDFMNVMSDTSASQSLSEKYAPQIQALMQDSSATEEKANDLLVTMTTELIQSYESKIDALKTKSHTETITLVKKGKDKDAKWKIKEVKVPDASSEAAQNALSSFSSNV